MLIPVTKIFLFSPLSFRHRKLSQLLLSWQLVCGGWWFPTSQNSFRDKKLVINRLMDCVALPCEKHSQTSGVTCTHRAICVQVCMSAFKMHKFGGTVSRFYSLICCYGISKDCQHLLLALKRFLDFEREYLPQRTLILILICNLTYFPSPYLLEVGKQNWWKSLC